MITRSEQLFINRVRAGMTQGEYAARYRVVASTYRKCETNITPVPASWKIVTINTIDSVERFMLLRRRQFTDCERMAAAILEQDRPDVRHLIAAKDFASRGVVANDSLTQRSIAKRIRDEESRMRHPYLITAWWGDQDV